MNDSGTGLSQKGSVCHHQGETGTYCTKCWVNLDEARMEGGRGSDPPTANATEPTATAKKSVAGHAPDPLRNVRIGGTAAVIAGFFMPWVTMGPFSVAGNKVTESGLELGWMGKGFGSGLGSKALLLYLPYAVPVLGLLTVLDGLTYRGLDQRSKILGVLTGGLPIAGLVWLLSQTGTAIFEMLAVGACIGVVLPGDRAGLLRSIRTGRFR